MLDRHAKTKNRDMYSAATPVLDLAGDQGSIDGSIDLYIHL